MLSGAVLDLDGVGALAEPLTLNGTGIAYGGALINSVAGSPSLTGNVTLGSAGTSIVLNNGTATFNGNFSGGFDLNIGGSANIAVGGIIDATITTLTKSGTGTLTLSGVNAYTGITTVNAGMLSVNSIAPVGSAGSALGAPATAANGTIYLGAASTLQYTGGGSTSDRAIVLTGAATLDASGGALVLSSGVTSTSQNLTLTGIGSGSLGAVALNSGSVTKTGANTWTLTGINTYSGTTTVDTGTLAFNGGTQSLAGGLTFGAVLATGNVGNLDLTNSSVSFGGALNVQYNNTIAGVITIGTGKTLTVGGAVTIGYASTTANATTTNLTMTGGGTFVANNTASGAVFQVGGANTNASTAIAGAATLDLTGLSAFFCTMNAASSTFRVNNNTTVNNNSFSTLLLPKTGLGATTILTQNFNVGDQSGNNGLATNSVQLGTGVSTIYATNFNLGTGGRDVGTVTFAGAMGSIVVRDATGAGRSALSLGTGAATTGANGVGNSNVLDVSGHSADLLLGAVVMGTQNRGAPYTNTLAFDQGKIDMTSLTMSTRTADSGNGLGLARSTTSTVNIGGGTVTIQNGVLSMAAASGTYTATDPNPTMNATINVNGGAVTIGATAGVSVTMAADSATGGSGTAQSNATLNLNGGVTTLNGTVVKTGGASPTNAIVAFNGGTLKAGLSSTTFIQGLNAVNVLDNGATVDTNGFNVTIGQPLLNGGTGAGGLAKLSAGTLTLASANTYGGATAVNGGTLLVSGSIAAGASTVASGATLAVAGTAGGPVTLASGGTCSVTGTVAASVTAASGATVMGTGTINGTLTLNGAALAPGNSGVGTLSVNGNVVLNAANLNFDLSFPGAPGNSDLVVGTGTPTLDLGTTPSVLTVNRLTGFSLGTYTLFSGYTIANAADLPTVTPIPGVTMATSVSGNALLLNVTAINTGAARATWTGSDGVNHLWSNPANWGGTDITIGGPYELFFPAVPATFADYTPNDDIAALTIHAIVINSAAPYTIGTVAPGGTVTIDGNGSTPNVAISVVSGSHTIATTPLAWSTQDQIISVAAGGLALSSAIIDGAFQTYFNNTADMTYSGVLGSGATPTGGLIKLGAGNLTLSGTSLYTGINTIAAGTLSVTSSNNLGASAAANSITFPILNTGTLQISGSGFANTNKGVVLNSNGVISVLNAADSGVFSTTAVISGSGNLIKSGAGTLNLNAANTLTGGVVINARRRAARQRHRAGAGGHGGCFIRFRQHRHSALERQQRDRRFAEHQRDGGHAGG